MTYSRPDDRYPKSWNRLRHLIFARDHYRCQICGKKLDRSTKGRIPVCHHIKPIAYSNDNSFKNLITLCPRCHRRIHRIYLSKKEKEGKHNGKNKSTR